MIYDLIIIGGGPAGITAGIYAARKKLNTLLLTKDFLGQVGKTGQVDNWPGAPAISGMNLIKKFEEHLRKFTLTIKTDCLVNKIAQKKNLFFVKTKNKGQFSSKAVIIAAGSRPRTLGAPGEKEFLNRGVSYCSICDAPFFRDKKVIVIGGGNSGFETALDLAKYAKMVSLLERSKKVAADEALQERAKQEKIAVFTNKELKRIEGRARVESVVYQDLITNKTFQQPADGVFIAIGTTPIADFVEGLVRMNKEGEIKVDSQTYQTSTKGIFAAGDVNDSGRKQIVVAVSQGCEAALAVYDYLQDYADKVN